jgi:PAS domain S-box-containing protein
MKPLDHRSFEAAIATEGAEDGRYGAHALRNMRKVLDSIPQMVWASFPTRERLEYYNSRWRDFTGVTLSWDGSTRLELIHPDDRGRAMATWDRCRTSGEPYEAQYRLLHVSGEHRWILSRGRAERDGHGRIICWYGTCTDIHDLVLARQALSASEQLNRTIIAASGDSIKLLDRDGRILFANAAAVDEVGGSDPAELIGTKWLEGLPANSRVAAREALDEALAGKRARFTTLRMDDPNEPHWRDFMVSPVAGGEGSGQGVVVS